VQLAWVAQRRGPDAEDVAAEAAFRLVVIAKRGAPPSKPAMALHVYFGSIARNVGRERRRKQLSTIPPGDLDVRIEPSSCPVPDPEEPSRADLECLDGRERDLSRLLAAGHSVDEIATLARLPSGEVATLLGCAARRMTAERKRAPAWAFRLLGSTRTSGIGRELVEGHLRGTPLPETCRRLGVSAGTAKMWLRRKINLDFRYFPGSERHL